MLPAIRPLRTTKFIFSRIRATIPTTSSGTMVIHKPARSQMGPSWLRSVSINRDPAFSPTQARKRTMPSLMARFAPVGVCQTTRPMRPSQLSKIAATKGPLSESKPNWHRQARHGDGDQAPHDTKRDPRKRVENGFDSAPWSSSPRGLRLRPILRSRRQHAGYRQTRPGSPLEP